MLQLMSELQKLVTAITAGLGNICLFGEDILPSQNAGGGNFNTFFKSGQQQVRPDTN